MGHRTYRPTPREMQVRHLSKRHGLNIRQAELLASLYFGEVAA